MSTTATSTAFAPTPFILREKFTTIDCPLAGYEGLWVEVRMNLTNGELQVLREQLQELDDRSDEISDAYLDRAQGIDERLKTLDKEDHKGRRELQREGRANQRAYIADLKPIGLERRNLVAPHIRNWNFYEPGVDGGEPTLLPPPCQNPESLTDVSQDVVMWLCREVLNAYTGGSGFSTGSAKSGTAPEPTQTQNTGGPQIREASSPSRRSRKK